MSEVSKTAALPAVKPKPLIGDGSGRYRILIVGNSGTLSFTNPHIREQNKLNRMDSALFSLRGRLGFIIQGLER